MPRYFFHLRNEVEHLLDPHGQMIDDPSNVPATALREVRALISQDALKGEINLDQRLEVQDTDGKLVYSLEFADAVRIRTGSD